jgi:hypothetical protein
MRRMIAVPFVVLVIASLTSTALARELSGWSPAVNLGSIAGTSAALNTPALEGCPIQSPDGLELFIASNRPGGQGQLDIWVASRASRDAPWGAPENLGEPINGPHNDFCPSPMRGNRFFFVSDRPSECGDEPNRGADIYVSRRHPVRGYGAPENVGCAVNSAAGEASPSYFEDDRGRAWLFFSSNRSGVSDLYVSELGPDGAFGAAVPVDGVNSDFEDARPNVRRDGLELVFDSTRPGGEGGADVWAATRASVDATWSAPVNLGPAVNSPANETRPSLSWDGMTLYFGSNRVGSVPSLDGPPSADIYVSHRQRVTGRNR